MGNHLRVPYNRLVAQVSLALYSCSLSNAKNLWRNWCTRIALSNSVVLYLLRQVASYALFLVLLLLTLVNPLDRPDSIDPNWYDVMATLWALGYILADFQIMTQVTQYSYLKIRESGKNVVVSSTRSSRKASSRGRELLKRICGCPGRRAFCRTTSMCTGCSATARTSQDLSLSTLDITAKGNIRQVRSAVRTCI